MADDVARGADGAFYREFEVEGQKVRATIVPISDAEEHWSTLLLANGATLRMKAVVTEVCMLEGRWTSNGEPVYSLSTVNVVASISPPGLRRP